jgi:hypothetical protein
MPAGRSAPPPHFEVVSAPASRRTMIVGVLVAAFLCLQLAVPAVALFGPRPGRFAWQMYSALPDLPQAWVVEADGDERLVDLTRLFAVRRAEIDYVAVMRAGLCDATGAAAVRIQPAHAPSELVACQ